jgi:hypothetical protein
MGPYAEVDYYSPYLIVNSVVSGEDLSFWLSTLYLSANFQNNKKEKREFREGEGNAWVRADLTFLNRHFMEKGQPHT